MNEKCELILVINALIYELQCRYLQKLQNVTESFHFEKLFICKYELFKSLYMSHGYLSQKKNKQTNKQTTITILAICVTQLQNILCSKTHLDGTTHEQTIICRQLGPVVDSKPIKMKNKYIE